MRSTPAKRRPMRVVVLAATKGGTGKTTLSAALAVRAAKESDRVAMIDADPQNSLERWWELRGEPENPQIMGVSCSAEGLGLLMAEGWDWVFIDTPTGNIDMVAEAVSVADYVLIPSRASALDVEAMDHVVQVCKEFEKPYAFVLNAVQTGWDITDSAAAYLRRMGKVLDARVSFRKSFTVSMASGKSGAEKDSRAAEEIEALWSSVKRSAARAGAK